jgi:hypothetical protein
MIPSADRTDAAGVSAWGSFLNAFQVGAFPGEDLRRPVRADDVIDLAFDFDRGHVFAAGKTASRRSQGQSFVPASHRLQRVFGTKHQPMLGRPVLSISWMFMAVPCWIRYRLPLWQPVTSK